MAEKQSTPELKEYHGSCHCGGFKFSVKLAPLEKVTACNCSHCAKVCAEQLFILIFSYDALLTPIVNRMATFGFSPPRTTTSRWRREKGA